MPWTAPKTWVDNELVTASQLNQHLRDNLLNVKARLDGNIPAIATNSTTTYTSTTATFAQIGPHVHTVYWPVASNATVWFAGTAKHSALGGEVRLDLEVNGTRLGDPTYGSALLQNNGSATIYAPMIFMWFLALPPNFSNVIKAVFATNGATASVAFTSTMVTYIHKLPE